MKSLQFNTDQPNHSNHLSRQAPTNGALLQQVRDILCQKERSSAFISFGPGRGQGITTHSIPRGERSGNWRLAKGPQYLDSPAEFRG